MDELPNDLRDIIELARDEYDPPDDLAKQRVRIALAAAIGVPTAGAVLGAGKAAAMGSKAPAALLGQAGASKAGWLAFGGKLTAVALGTVAAAGVGIALYASRTPTATPVQTPVLAPVVQQLPAAEPAPTPEVKPLAELAAPTQVEAQEQPAQEKAAKPHKAAQPAVDTLAEEMALLRTASEALARGDEDAALVQLRTHSKRFPRGSLREERDGLRAIAECTRDQNPSQQAAQRFAQLYPNSLLAARVSAACRAH